MKTIILTGWEDGMDKVGLTKLQTELPDITLKAAKTNTDNLLNGEKVLIPVADEHTAVRFCHALEQLGVKFTANPGAALRIMDIFHISGDTTFLILHNPQDIALQFPGRATVYLNEIAVTETMLGGIVMDSSTLRSEQQLTVWVKEHLDKAQFNFNEVMTLLIH